MTNGANGNGKMRILVVAAHPDDIEFGAAGSIAKWVQQGAEVTYCLITNGAAGSNEALRDLQKLINEREEEQRAAAAIVGVKDVRFLNYQDGVLEPTLQLRRDLTRVIRDVRPYRVVCQDPTTFFVVPDYINHPDHRAAGEATIYAVFPSAETRPIFPELLDEGLEPHHVTELYLDLTTKPNTFIDITETMELKLQSLLCHKSQLGPEVVEMVRQWNKESGKQIASGYAEVFRVLRFPREEIVAQGEVLDQSQSAAV